MDTHAINIQQVIIELAEQVEVKVRFVQGRRDTDILLVYLQGTRPDVLILPVELLESFPELDLEIIKSHGPANDYTLRLAVTIKRDEQPTQIPERRLKLKAFIDGEMAQP